MNKTLLIDGDIVAYQIACKFERGPDWDGDGDRSKSPDPNHLRDECEAWVSNLKRDLQAAGAVVTLSDPSRRYFRHDIWPSYKTNRQQGTPPKSLGTVKEILRNGGNSWVPDWVTSLEADDVMGIRADAHTIIVTEDKDLQQIPGDHYWLHKKDLGIEYISPDQADYFHLWQTLVGDPIDGFPGLPKVGPVKAAKILDVPARDRWKAIVAAFEAGGFSEDDAIVQARVSRILRSTDYDFDHEVPLLWTPSSF